jgi:prenyl protein peptidase
MLPINELAELSLMRAHLLAGFCASSYVGILYLLQQTRITYSSQSLEGQAKERARRRDDPDVIRARLAAVSASTLISCAVVLGVVWHLSAGNEVRTIHHKLFD